MGVNDLAEFLAACYDEAEQEVTDGRWLGLPERRLADIKLKRAVLADVARICEVSNDLGAFRLAARTMRRLGTEFADRPGYRQEWAP